MFWKNMTRVNGGAIILATLALWGCTSETGGIVALQPFSDGGQYTGQKTDNIVNVRLSEAGVDYLNTEWESLVEAFAPGQVLRLPFTCIETNVPVFGDVIVADQGGLPDGGVCNSESCGQMDRKCDTKDSPAIIEARIVDFQLTPRPPDELEARLALDIDTGKIFIAEKGGGVKCSVVYDTARAAPNSNRIRAGLKFSIDQKWDKLMTFQVTTINGAAVCGASGALPAPDCLEPDDIDISGENFGGSLTCGIADWGFVKNFILRRISPTLEEQVRAQVETQRCTACGTGLPACPAINGATSTCEEGICVDDATGACVPRRLGVEGRVQSSLLLASYGVPPESKVDVSVAAGSSVSVDTGLSIGTRGGVQAVSVASCVKPTAAPVYSAIPAPNFDAEAPPGDYHVGLGLSQPFLDLAMHHAQQSGSLCISLGSNNVGLLSTELFGKFLPSLGRLATKDGKDAPMRVVLTPGKPPTVRVGAGTYDPVTKKPIDALLTLALQDATIDLYATFDDREARLFTLTADIALPLSLIFEGCSGVQPALGDLKQLVTNVRTANSEILAEDPAILSDLIPAIVGFSEPAIASALTPFTLPELGGFKLKVTGTKGLGNISGTGGYSHLGLFARLLPANAACAVSGPRTRALLVEGRIPKEDDMRLTGRGLPWPVAVLDVASEGAGAKAEFAYRINGGLWSTWLPAPGGRLEVSHPSFVLQGTHRIDVRSRVAEQPGTESVPVKVPFVVDWSAPDVTWVVDEAHDRLSVKAHDAVTPVEQLSYSYQLGTEPASPFGPARVFELSRAESASSVVVRVRDSFGNIGTAVWRAPSVDVRADVETSPESHSGCQSTGGSLSVISLLTIVFLVSRKRSFR